MDAVARPFVLLTVFCAWAVFAASVGAVGEPAGPAPPGDSASAVGVDDWDWDAVTGLDDAPVIAPSSGTQSRSLSDYVAPREIENAFPDFDAEPRQGYAVFKDVPPFEVIPSQRDPGMHPCSSCHQWVKGDPSPRNLKKPHDGFQLSHGLHGKGAFWCFTCHDLEGSGGLRTLEGEKLDFGDAYILCSQCHSRQARDWAYGAHGKRVSGWQGKRQVLNCTACHYQHRPRLKPREPKAGPRVRMGLERPEHWVSQDQRPGPDHGVRSTWKRARSDDAVLERDKGNGSQQVISEALVNDEKS